MIPFQKKDAKVNAAELILTSICSIQLVAARKLKIFYETGFFACWKLFTSLQKLTVDGLPECCCFDSYKRFMNLVKYVSKS